MPDLRTVADSNLQFEPSFYNSEFSNFSLNDYPGTFPLTREGIDQWIATTSLVIKNNSQNFTAISINWGFISTNNGLHFITPTISNELNNFHKLSLMNILFK